MAKSGASKGAKKIDPFNSGKLAGINVFPRIDTHLPSDGPGSLLDRRDTDFIRDQREQHERRPGRGYESDIKYGKKKTKKKTRKA